MSPSRYASTKQFRTISNPETHCDGDPEPRYAILSRGRSGRYRCGYGLFRDVFGEQITFCFGNLTVPHDAVPIQQRRLTLSPRKNAVTEKQLTCETPLRLRTLRRIRKSSVRRRCPKDPRESLLQCRSLSRAPAQIGRGRVYERRPALRTYRYRDGAKIK